MPSLPVDPRTDRIHPVVPGDGAMPARRSASGAPATIGPEPAAASEPDAAPASASASASASATVPPTGGTGEDALLADPRRADPLPASWPSDERSAVPEWQRARWRDRRTGLIALVVATVALWAVIAAAVGFATTM
jgi:hypothetical protein